MDNITLYNILVGSTSSSIKKSKFTGKLNLYKLHLLSLFGRLLNDFNSSLPLNDSRLLEQGIRVIRDSNDYICNYKDSATTLTGENVINTKPVINNTTATVSLESYNFKEIDFTKNYSDSDLPLKVKIKTLPTDGTLSYNDNSVSIDDEILLSNISNLVYTRGSLLTDSFDFQIQDNNKNNPLLSNTSTINLTIEEIVIPNVDNSNQLSINDFTLSLPDLNYYFSKETLLKGVSEDTCKLVKNFKITSLPSNATLYYVNRPVEINEEFAINEANLLNIIRDNTTSSTTNFIYKFNSASNSTYTNDITVTLNLLEISNNANIIDNVISNVSVSIDDIFYPFLTNDFIKSYSGNNTVDKILLTSLTSNGTLYYGNQEIANNSEFSVSELSNLVYEWNNYQNETDTINFKLNTIENNTYSDMATMTLNISAQVNLPPSSVGTLTLNLDNSTTHIFTIDNFTTETTPVYVDPEGDSVDTIKVTSLPVKGILKLSDTELNLNDVISYSDIIAGNLKYVTDSSDATSHTDSFTFSIADEGSLQYTSGGNVNINIAAYVNKAPTVGDSNIVIEEGDIYVFQKDNFLIDPDPDYADAENDPAVAVRFPTLPSTGVIRLNNTDVTINQEILLTDVDNQLLTYTQDLNAGGTMPTFTFNVKDSNGNWSN